MIMIDSETYRRLIGEHAAPSAAPTLSGKSTLILLNSYAVTSQGAA